MTHSNTLSLSLFWQPQEKNNNSDIEQALEKKWQKQVP